MLKKYFTTLLDRRSLTRAECREATLAMLDEGVSSAEIAAFLVLLAAKVEVLEEILGVIDALQANMQTLSIAGSALDIVGTGGDRSGSVNISTGAAILAASAGVKVVKNGNRSVSSACGSADVLESLGIDIDMPIEKIQSGVEKLNMGFCFAQKFHPAFAKLRNLRKDLGTPTVFNWVGPFLNPARVQHCLLGVAVESLMPLFAKVLVQFAPKKSAIVHSAGMDEMTCSADTQVIEIENSKLRFYTVNPKDFGIPLHPLSALQGGDAKRNAQLLIETFSGEHNAIADALILNAGMAIYLYGLEKNIALGIERARYHLQNQDALRLLQEWRNF